MTVIEGNAAEIGRLRRSDMQLDAVFMAAIAAGLATIALIYAALFFWSARIDAVSQEREVRLVENGVAAEIKEIEDALTSVTQWDDAVAYTNPPLDRDWVDTNIGAFIDQSLAMDAALLIDAGDVPVYAMQAGAETDPAMLAPLMEAAAPLLRNVRQQEAARGSFPEGDGDTVISTPIRASAAQLLNGAPSIVTATLIQPDFGLATPAGPRGAIVVSADRFDAAFAGLTEHYLLAGASLHAGETEAGPGEARAFLHAPDGAAVATLLWSPETPGRRLLAAALPLVSLATIVLAVGGLLALAALRANVLSLRRTMRELVAARDAAHAADRAKSQFLAFMSHEIRTPLNGVLGMAQVMLMGEKDPTRRASLDVIKSSGESLLIILNDVLDLSKIEAGKVELNVAPFDMAELAASASAAFSGIARAKGLDFRLDIAESAQGVWRGDAARLRQILSNLVSNAVKFTETGGVDVAIRAEQRGGVCWLEMRVTDTGIGVPAATLPRLFQKFVQADTSHSRRFGGTGLGLAIAQDLAVLMGGRIGVKSLEGRGSSFWLEAPMERAEAAVSARARSAA